MIVICMFVLILPVNARPLLLSLSISSSFIEDIPTNVFREAFNSKSSDGLRYTFSTAQNPKFPNVLKIDSKVKISNPSFHLKFGNDFAVFSIKNFLVKSDSKILSSLPFPLNRKYEINLGLNVRNFH